MSQRLILIVILQSFGQLALSTTHHMKFTPLLNLQRRQNSPGPRPLLVTNQCDQVIHPAILTQSGTGPPIGGFALTSGNTRSLTVSEDWQGRVWGRTNCSFNSAGTSSASGHGRACVTGDCGSIINCQGTGETPVTLAEFTLDTGNGQTFYDISLVDGYNLPMAIVQHPNQNSSLQAIPPNLTNPSCVATVGNLAPQGYSPYTSGNGNFLGTNSSTELPFDQRVTSNQAATWCPWDLQVVSSTGPVGGVYIYPDGRIDRPAFDPCFSACARYNKPSDCCTGQYSSPSTCSPSAYSKAAKAVCPDAYSYAFDDQTSTFIIPSGAGFEVVFCPGARSTNILGTSKAKLTQLAQQGHVKKRDIVTHGYSSAVEPRSHGDSGIRNRLGRGLWCRYLASLSIVLLGMVAM